MYKFSEPDFQTMAVVLKESGVKNIDPDKVLRQVYSINATIEGIFEDKTITQEGKILKLQELYETQGIEMIRTMKKFREELEKEYNKVEEQKYPNMLRARDLTPDEKLLLPMIKDQYARTNDLTGSESYHKQILFLSDNGLVSDISYELDKLTPEEITAKSKAVNNAIVYTNNMARSAVGQIESFIESDQILAVKLDIEENQFSPK